MKRHYSIAFVGLGSIGKRHFKNVCAYLESCGDTYSIDLYRSDLTRALDDDIQAKVNRQIDVNTSIVCSYDMVFVTNPTSLHYETVSRFIGHTKSFFIEKPVFDSTDVDESIFERLDGSIAYVACPLRYNPVLQYVRANVDCGKAIAVRAMSSSYLPDWRSGQDYRKCYSAHRDLGGGVGIDLIHEWDYLTTLFGMPERVYSIQDKISSLEIDSDDIAIYIARTKQSTIELHLDYFGRKAQRTLDIFMPEDTIHCDLIAGTVEYLKENKVVKLDAERNAFQMEEIAHFFSIVDGNIANDSTIEHGYQILKLTKGYIS
jgi:predicted dehydrogenase